MNFHVYIHADKQTTERLKHIMAQLDDLTAQVKANTDVESSAITLIQGLADKLQNAGTDAGKLQALQAELRTSADALGAAVAANTAPAPAVPTATTTTTAPPTT